MIRIEKIFIQEFRGIRNLTLDLKGQNFAACGPNGTGKSGIVDAIEFALTGNISRLSGSGTGGLSVKTHGPHVDSRKNPELALVRLDVSIPSLGGKKAQIERTVKTAGAPKITPAHADVLAVFTDVNLHPEFSLSRREIIRYVLSEPGQRSKEVQALLRLEDIEKLRVVLQKIANASIRDLPNQQRFETEARDNLLKALGIAKLAEKEALDAVNPKREILGLPLLTKLDTATSLKDGLAETTETAIAGRVVKTQATADLILLETTLQDLRSEDFAKNCALAITTATELGKDADSLDGLSRESLLKTALEQYDGSTCPVCDSAFEPGAFELHLAEKLTHLDEVTKKRATLEGEVKPILDSLLASGTALAAVIAHGALFAAPLDTKDIQEFKGVLLGRYKQLQKLLPIEDTRAVLASAHSIPDFSATIEVMKVAIKALPEPTKQDSARDFLVLAQERLDQYRTNRGKVAATKSRSDLAAKVVAKYGEVTTSSLEKIYQSVERTFSAYYRKINADDESTFTGKLMPSLGKLGFDVDFYGRGHFPPGAYHSEGHQDGMGLCLYLALMNHLLGAKFTFAVLDDVLMSVDAGHRRQVCSLLRESFPDTQFIFTTHDEIWLRHMKSEGLIKGPGFVHFRTWTVDIGPTDWDDHDVWKEIDGYLAKGDVRSSAALLRHYLEHFAKEACDRLRAKVEFRGDAQFALGDLLPNATNELGVLLKKGKATGSSWGQTDVVEKAEIRIATFDEAKKKTNHEMWQINTAVHFNAWADLKKEDFIPVVTAFKTFGESFRCFNCAEMYFVTPDRSSKEALRCGCGAVNLNLIPKGS